MPGLRDPEYLSGRQTTESVEQKVSRSHLAVLRYFLVSNSNANLRPLCHPLACTGESFNTV
jgi:hypothetical protein